MLPCVFLRLEGEEVAHPHVERAGDAVVIGSVADATLLVVREDFVKRTQVANACDQLRIAGAHLVGTVMNCWEKAVPEHYGECAEGE